MQLRSYEPRPDGPEDLRQLLPLAQDGNRLNNHNARLRERVAAVQTFFVLDNLRCQLLLAHGCDHITGEFRPCPDIVPLRIHL
jgi:hypothetical protein